MANKIQIKRGLKSKLPKLEVGEPGLCTDTNEVYLGGPSANIQLAKFADIEGNIVNNLTAGGTTKSFSAEQGKVLSSQLEDIYKRSFASGNTKVCTNALLISDEYDGYTGAIQGQTINLPEGFEVGIRLQLRYDANNYMLKIYDTQRNKEWINFYNGVNWCGWREISLGEINLNKKPVCKLYRTTEQIVPVRTEIRVAWEHVLFQSHPNMYIPEASVNIYAPIKGLYRVNATVVVKSEQAGYTIACDMKKNASEYVVTDKCVSNSATFNVMKLDGLHVLSANDYFTITLSHENPSGMTIHPTSRIEIEYIREVF